MTDTYIGFNERVRIFDRQGFQVSEFLASVDRSWILFGEGRASVNLPTINTKYVNETALQYGNWIYIQSADLPDWVGMIDVPREWQDNAVIVNAFSPERLLRYRRGPLSRTIKGSAGEIFQYILRLVNKNERTILRPGDIFAGGKTRQETFHPTPLTNNLKRIQERSKNEYSWRAMVEGGKLVIYGDWSKYYGQDYRQVQLILGKEGGNLDSGARNIIVEDSPLENDILVYGEGVDWPNRPTARAIDTDSIAAYGLRENGIGGGGANKKDTLKLRAQKYLEGSKEPLLRFNVKVLPVGNIFSYLGTGNFISVQMEGIGFRTGLENGIKCEARILGMSFKPDTERKVELVLEEVQ